MPEDRRDEYLDTVDDLAGWAIVFDMATGNSDAHAPGFDEWNALRLSQGQRPGTFSDYLTEIAPRLGSADSERR